MMLAKVIGSVISTAKHDCYQNKKLMMLKPITPQGEEQSGVHIAVDMVGAGKGDIVLMSSEGRAAEELNHFSCRMPMRSIIIAIVDKLEEKI